MAKTTTKSAESKRNFAYKTLKAASLKGVAESIVILPEYDEEEDSLLDNCAIPSPKSTKGMGYIALFQTREVILKTNSGTVEFENELWCIHRGNVDRLEAKYSAGQLLKGNIITKDTMELPNPNDPNQGYKYISAACREAEAFCTIKGQPIYQIKYWDNSGMDEDITIAHDNQEELDEVTNAANAAANKATSKGILAAGAAKSRRAMPKA
jgi:hypothetical protein